MDASDFARETLCDGVGRAAPLYSALRAELESAGPDEIRLRKPHLPQGLKVPASIQAYSFTVRPVVPSHQCLLAQPLASLLQRSIPVLINPTYAAVAGHLARP
jgi:hypothetical protein